MNLANVDWSLIPAPANDGAASHLTGSSLPDVNQPATDGASVNLSNLKGLGVVYVYPMTGRPDRALPDDWDQIPGARGCTPQSCSFRDHHAELPGLGVNYLYGMSTQDTDYQTEAVTRLHLPFPLLSDVDHTFGDALALPNMEVEGKRLLRRLTLIIRDGVIAHVFYPVFPPDQDAQNVIAWLKENVE